MATVLACLPPTWGMSWLFLHSHSYSPPVVIPTFSSVLATTCHPLCLPPCATNSNLPGPVKAALKIHKQCYHQGTKNLHLQLTVYIRTARSALVTYEEREMLRHRLRSTAVYIYDIASTGPHSHFLSTAACVVSRLLLISKLMILKNHYQSSNWSPLGLESCSLSVSYTGTLDMWLSQFVYFIWHGCIGFYPHQKTAPLAVLLQ